MEDAMRVWLMLTAMALVVAAVLIVACGGDDGTPQGSTHSEEEASKIVRVQLSAACPGMANYWLNEPPTGYWTGGVWVFTTLGASFTVEELGQTVKPLADSSGNPDPIAAAYLSGQHKACD